jgi:HAD domain in Swiss Army Knife RNA repair proteins
LTIVFLDIDGVLNSDDRRSRLAESSSLDPRAVARLNSILLETGARLVLSSSWRYVILGGAMTLQGFEYLLRTHGVANDCLAGHTCPDEETAGRGAQIRRWLDEHGPVTAWAALDDMPLDLGDDSWHHVQTDPRVGLSDDDAASIICILRGQRPAPRRPPP